VASDGAAEQADEADGRRGALPRDGTDGIRSSSAVFCGPDRRCDILRTWKGTTFTMTD